jgi:hypothetical protein
MSGNLTQINEILFPSRPSPSPRRWVVDVIAKEIDSSRLPYHPPDGSLPLPSELLLFLSPHALLLDHDARTGLTHMLTSVAHACFYHPSTLVLRSAYTSFISCATYLRNATLPHCLVSKGCTLLPR